MFFWKQKKEKTALVTIHGFGKRVSHEFDPLVKALSNDEYDIITFDMFNPKDENGCELEKMDSRVVRKKWKRLKMNTTI